MSEIPASVRPFVAMLPVFIPFLLVVLYLRVRAGDSPARLAELYPAVDPARGTRRTRERAVFGRGYFSMCWVKIGADHAHLHVEILNSLRGTGSFSVPLAEVTAMPDRYGWMILAPDVVRLRLARAPEVVLLVWAKTFYRLTEASTERLRLSADGTA